MNLEISVDEELRYLANAMTADARAAMFLANKVLTDEQRKAIFAKNGGSGSGSGHRQVYTRASPNGGGGSGGGSSTGPLTVQTTRNGTSGGGYHYTGAGDMTSSWVTSLSPDQMKEELKNDPDRLRSAIEEQLRMGAYDGITINGHKPSVNDIINGSIAPDYRETKYVDSSDFYKMTHPDPLEGATAQAVNSPAVEAVKQALTGGGSSGGVGGGGSLTSSTTDVSTSTSGGGGGGGAGGSLSDAIESIDTSADGPAGGVSNGPTSLDEFLSALANAHF